MRKILLFSCMLFFSCKYVHSQERTVSNPCAGVLINGMCWAECNVDSPGTFAANPKAYGMLYQWNRKKGWPAKGSVIGWDSSYPSGDSWEVVNDPCPTGWRVPTIGEIATLLDDMKVTSVHTSQNGVYGMKFTDKVTGNAIFLPGVSYRTGNGDTVNKDYNGWYWSSSSNNSMFAWILFFITNTPVPSKLYFPTYSGLSVRCVADWDLPDCDSIVKDTSATICAGDLPYTWGDTVFQVGTTTGKYRFQRTSTVTGCDSIVYLTLTVNPVYETTIYDTICLGDAYYQHGFHLPNVTASGDHCLSLVSRTGCDSILSLHLFLREHADCKSCAGVLINGVCWAESNVDSPGTFAATPEAYGMLYQWNRKKEWSPTGTVSGWDNSFPSGDSWEAANDPCPAGWRVPATGEIATLLDDTKVTSVWTSQNRVYGRKVTDKATGNSIFLPGVSYRDGNNETSNPGYYGWYSSSSSQSSMSAWILYFINTPYIGQVNFPKIYGLSVRCVANPDFTGCDSIVRNTSATICAGDLPYTWGDTIFQVGTTTGKYRFQRTSTVTGCDSIVYLYLTVNPVYNMPLYDTVCQGNSYYKHGFSLPNVQSSGSFQLSLQTVYGCDSTIILNLSVYPTYFYPRSESICEGDTIDFRGRRLYESGIYYDTLTTVKGCDSIYCMNLTVRPVPHLSFSDVVCYGSEYTKNGFHLPVVWADTLVSDTLQSMWGCDSIRDLYLTVNPLYNTLLYDTICQGDSYYQHGFSLINVQSGGSHSLSLLSRVGCDSILSLHLTVFPGVQQILYDSVCPSSRYVKHGFDLSDVITGGSFQLPLQTVYGCDSMVILNLSVYPTYLNPHSESFCEGDTIDFRGKRLYESGIYYDTLTTIKGCDSIIMLELREEKKIQGSIALLLEDCVTHTYTFSFESEIPVSSWQWDMGDGTVLHSEKGFHNYPDSGVYRIELRTQTYNGCENTFSYVKHVPHYMPEVQFQADRQIIDQGFPTVHFRVEVLPDMTCIWDFGDGTTGEGVSVSHTYNLNSEKYYDVMLSVVNAEGCITKSRAQIEADLLLNPVNTFSPNGDGINDVFMAGYRIEIVNRNGLRVYVGDSGWDGTYNGRQAPQDTYFYRLYYQTSSGEKMKTGYVTLIR